jgi:hypothetical protein
MTSNTKSCKIWTIIEEAQIAGARINNQDGKTQSRSTSGAYEH